jgi:ABC-2 type transport system permease protein
VRIYAATREPSWLIGEVLFPVVGMFAYVYIYRALGAPRAYEAFVVVGGVMLAYWLAVLWSMAAQFHWDKQGGQLELYMVAPCSRLAILTGMAIGGIVMTSIRAVSAFVLGLVLFRVPFHPAQPLALAAVFLLTLGALYALGMCLSSLFLMWGREIWQLSHALQEPVFLASGLYFPLRALGPWAITAVSALPLAIGLDAMRQMMFTPAVAQGLLPLRDEIAVLAASLGAFLALSVWLLGWMERTAKREGTLVMRHQ